MRKPRVLFCTESSFINSGYANYTRELLNSLNKTGKYELAELASYGKSDDDRINDLPWSYYGVVPTESNNTEEELYEYASKKSNEFGELAFEKTCLDFLPDVVCDIRDFWMMEYQSRSPFRDYFKWVIMPTVDAYPQQSQWVQTFNSADKCLTYTDWAGEVLKKQSGGKIDHVGSAPPIVPDVFKPMNKLDCRSELMINEDFRVVGTVMRNQRRKLYPDLFKSFSKLISDDSYSDCCLYCHTGYPDQGWDIPELLIEYGLSSRVLFTYMCKSTGKCFASLFRGPVCKSPFTGKYEAVLPTVGKSVSEEYLAKIMNSFDVYVQYANSEGFGMPQIEAAACEVGVINIGYSGMLDVAKNISAISIEPLTLTKESGTGCERAIPNNEEFVKVLGETLDRDTVKFGKLARQSYLKNYSWQKSVGKWEEAIDSFEISETFENWKKEPRIFDPAQMPKSFDGVTVIEAAKWLIINVLREPEKCGTAFEDMLVRDLTYASKTNCTGGVYFNESSSAFDGQWSRKRFDIRSAYVEMYKMCENRNNWEAKRIQEGLKNDKLQKMPI